MSGEEYDMSRPCRVCGAGIGAPCRRYTNEFEKEGAMLGNPTPWPHRFGGRVEGDATTVSALLDERDALLAQVERVRALAGRWGLADADDSGAFSILVAALCNALDGPQ